MGHGSLNELPRFLAKLSLKGLTCCNRRKEIGKKIGIGKEEVGESS
jgi:hypothetical protein